jgi:beta-N-acetylhexosaminidase
MHAAIVGIAGPELSAEEDTLLRARPPAGVILFARNIVSPTQLKSLIRTLRRLLPGEAVVMVDQEGGRVARLRPPHWIAHPPAATIGALFVRDATAGVRAAWLTGALIGLDCAACGFDVVCAPVLDLRVPGAHDIVGDRAFAQEPEDVARLGAAGAAGLLAAGIQPVGKHAPGHGRAQVDSHLSLPVVEGGIQEDELVPFRRNARLPWMMTAHIRYQALDERPATLSPRIIGEVIRRRIGFEGVLVSDDLAMQALEGDRAELACDALMAGCDLALYCPGDPATKAVLHMVPAITGACAARLAAAKALALDSRLALDAAALLEERNGLLS